MKPSIKLQNVTKTFSIRGDRKYSFRSLVASWFKQGKNTPFVALDDLNMDIFPGDFVGIIGHNGSGKSTLLKLIAGIYVPDKGSVIDIQGSLVPFLELGVGFNPELSGGENIYLNGTILGMTQSYLEQKFDDIVAFAQLEEFIRTPVKNYSSGMMVRLAFSIAIQADADNYILDEVLGVGDEQFRRKSEQLVKELASKGKTILYVSHELEEVEALCNKVAWIDHGKLRFFGDTEEGLAMYRASVDKVIEPLHEEGH